MSERSGKSRSTAQRRAQLAALRLAGVDFATIVERLGYRSQAAALADYEAFLTESTQRALDREGARQVELDRLDRLQAAVWSSAVRGEIQAIDAALRVMDRRMRLLGLDSRKAEPARPAVESAKEGAGVSDLSKRIAERRKKASG